MSLLGGSLAWHQLGISCGTELHRRSSRRPLLSGLLNLSCRETIRSVEVNLKACSLERI